MSYRLWKSDFANCCRYLILAVVLLWEIPSSAVLDIPHTEVGSL